MISILGTDEIDQKKWDQCILHSEHGNIYGLFDSVNLACSRWVGVIYNDYEAVVALPIKRKLGLSYAWHPQFMGPLGIYAKTENASIFSGMFKEMCKHSWWIKMYYWQLSELKEYKISKRVYQELDLGGKSIELIRSGYNDNTKRNCKKATKLNLSIQHGDDINKVIKTFKDNKGGEIENIDSDSYVLLKKLMNHWVKKGMAHVTSIYNGDELLAIGCFLKYKERIIYYKGAITESAKGTGAMHLLIDYEISNHFNESKYFDFGGSNSTSVARFYKGFGGVDKNYFQYEFKKFKI